MLAKKRQFSSVALAFEDPFNIPALLRMVLKKFVNDKGKILPRRTTGACAKHQRDITLAVKRARHIAILPYAQN